MWKRKKYSAVKEAKRRSREVVGSLPPQRIISDKRKKPEKYKKDWKNENISIDL